MGRFIGPLVKLYRACGLPQALELALRLKDTCFAFVLSEDGAYDPKLFGFHTHSTTAMLSSLAQLGEAVGDEGIFRRVRALLDRGLSQITTDFGWCLEYYDRTNLGGEINNTADIMETCIILGNAGYAGYYDRAELILRAHYLPAQLLDTGFIPDCMDIADPATYRIARDAKGAFGFPCPYGHEYEPGSVIAFHWDIVGGGVGGLCEAWRNIVTKRAPNLLSINMLFAYESDDIAIKDPYENGDVLEFTLRKPFELVRVRIPQAAHADPLACVGCENAWRQGEFLYIAGATPQNPVRLSLTMRDRVQTYRFRAHRFKVAYHGQKVTGMTSLGKRLCYFPEIE